MIKQVPTLKPDTTQLKMFALVALCQQKINYIFYRYICLNISVPDVLQ